jgi:hypothetical protein
MTLPTRSGSPMSRSRQTSTTTRLGAASFSREVGLEQTADCRKLDPFHEILKQHLHAQRPETTIAELQHQLDDALAHHIGLLASMQGLRLRTSVGPHALKTFVGETGYARGPFSPMKREARGTLVRSGGTRRRKCGSAHDVLHADRIRRRKPYR